MAVGLSDGTGYENNEEWLSSTASTMPLGASTEPAGALKSAGGTTPTPESTNTRNTNPAQGPVTVNPWVIIGPEDIDKGISIAGSFGTGTMAGVVSKTIDKGALAVAQDALAQGTHPDEVFQKTGFFKGADDRWRYEIPDKDAKIKDSGFNIDSQVLSNKLGEAPNDLYTVKDKVPTSSAAPGKMALLQPTRLPDVLDHPDLYEAYPVLKSTKVMNFPYETASKGSMDMTHNVMYLAKDLDPEYAKSVMLHEAQHMVQREEGFSRGGNPAEFKDQDLMAFELYKRLIGEVEARNVQTRMNYSDTQRLLQSPRSTEDRPRFVQIPADQNGPALLKK